MMEKVILKLKLVRKERTEVLALFDSSCFSIG